MHLDPGTAFSLFGDFCIVVAAIAFLLVAGNARRRNQYGDD